MKYILFIMLVFFSACSLKPDIKNESKLFKFYIPVKVSVKDSSTNWYKKEGSNFIGIVDSNISVGGTFFKNNKEIVGFVYFMSNNTKYDLIKSKIFNCENNSSNIKYYIQGNLINPVYILKKQIFCFKH